MQYIEAKQVGHLYNRSIYSNIYMRGKKGVLYILGSHEMWKAACNKERIKKGYTS